MKKIRILVLDDVFTEQGDIDPEGCLIAALKRYLLKNTGLNWDINEKQSDEPDLPYCDVVPEVQELIKEDFGLEPDNSEPKLPEFN
jgi:hypothetical protein